LIAKIKCYVLLSSISLPDQIFLLLGRKISPPELVLANPGKGFVAVVELLFMGAEPDARMRLRDAVAVVTVYNRVVPHDERHEHKPFLKDVFFQLRKLVLGQRRAFCLKFRVYGQYGIHHGASISSGTYKPRAFSMASPISSICCRVILPRYFLTRRLSMVLICSSSTIPGSSSPWMRSA